MEQINPTDNHTEIITYYLVQVFGPLVWKQRASLFFLDPCKDTDVTEKKEMDQLEIIIIFAFKLLLSVSFYDDRLNLKDLRGSWYNKAL